MLTRTYCEPGPEQSDNLGQPVRSDFSAIDTVCVAWRVKQLWQDVSFKFFGRVPGRVQDCHQGQFGQLNRVEVVRSFERHEGRVDLAMVVRLVMVCMICAMFMLVFVRMSVR